MFVPYDKMDENFNQRHLSASDYRQFARVDWVVTEKIHGANFCVVIDDDLRYAKRKELLAPDDAFFDYRAVVDRLEIRFLELQQVVAQGLAAPFSTLLIYGELFGGGYPHPNVPANPDVDLVQTGVYYSPNVEFAVFDLAVEHNGKRAFVDYERACQWCQQADLLYARPLLVGSYTEAVNFDITFESTVSAQLGLPRLAFPNRAEGVVIKPLRELVVQTEKGLFRPIFKRKTREFAEERFHQAAKWESTALPLERVKEKLFDLLTINRLHNAASKIGRISTDADKEQLRSLLWEDLQTEFDQGIAPDFQRLSALCQQVLWTDWSAAVAQLLEDFLHSS